MHDGHYEHSVVDLSIPGRGMDWRFERTYRSDIKYYGPLGHNWEFNYNRRVMAVTARTLKEVQVSFPGAKVGDVLRLDGINRGDVYVSNADGSFTAPNGFFTRLTKNPDGSFSERDADGSMISYNKPTARGIGAMTSWADREGNTMRFEYNTLGQLVRVFDTLGRRIDYMYNSVGLLSEVRDFFGRSIRFEYDTLGNLVAVTSPAVTGTPNGNDFPLGKTERYTYSSGFQTERLNHNLLQIIAPNEVANGSFTPRVVVTYNNDIASPHADRALTQTIGGTNAAGVPAGGTLTYGYLVLGSAPAGDVTTPVFQTTETDRNANRTEYQYNQFGNVLRVREFTNRDVRPSDPDFFETRYEWSTDFKLLRVISPLGNTAEHVYDTANPDRFQQGNHLSATNLPDAARGGDQTFIKTTTTYEPIYNQVRTSIEPRGNDPGYVPQNGGATSAARYTTTYTFDYQEGTDFAGLGTKLGISAAATAARLAAAGVPMGLGDVNGDGRTDQIDGHVIRIQRPPVNLLAGSNQAAVEGTTLQPIVELYVYNNFGHRTRSVDPEGNVTEYAYYSVATPSGGAIDTAGGGYLAQIKRDTTSNPIRDSGTNPPPTLIRSVFQYDAVGNIVREIDGRGIATDFVVNQLNQVVQTVRAAAVPTSGPGIPDEPLPLVAFAYLERYFYDFNNNVVLHQVEDRGNTSSVDGNPLAADLPAGVPGASNPDPAGVPAFVDTLSKYDILDQAIDTLQEVRTDESTSVGESLWVC